MSAASDIILLDGAMGTELRARGVKVRDYRSSLWSALACLEAPAAVTRLHRDYIEAGADIITVNNYAVTPRLLAREGREAELETLTFKALQCVKAAIRTATRDAKIAGSLPPLGTTFDPDAVGTYDENLDVYRRMAAILAPHVDMFMCETLTTAEEARAAATAAEETGKPYFVSCTIEREGRALRGGDSFETVVKALDGLNPGALLVNCTSCNAVTEAIRLLRPLTDLAIGGYANPVMVEREGGEPEVVPTNPIGPDEYAAVARGWIKDGATVIGGCCDTNPAFIAALRSL